MGNLSAYPNLTAVLSKVGLPEPAQQGVANATGPTKTIGMNTPNTNPSNSSGLLGNAVGFLSNAGAIGLAGGVTPNTSINNPPSLLGNAVDGIMNNNNPIPVQNQNTAFGQAFIPNSQSLFGSMYQDDSSNPDYLRNAAMRLGY